MLLPNYMLILNIFQEKLIHQKKQLIVLLKSLLTEVFLGGKLQSIQIYLHLSSWS